MYYIDIDDPKDLKVCLVELHDLTQTEIEEWNSIEPLSMKMLNATKAMFSYTLIHNFSFFFHFKASFPFHFISFIL